MVLIDQHRIISVKEGGTAPPGVKVVNLPSATLLPGLIDSHVHLLFAGSEDPIEDLRSLDNELALDRMRTAARTTVAAGITTVRDLGDRDYLALHLREQFTRDQILGPEVLAAGPPITTPGGHCWFLGGQTTGIANIRRAIRQRARRGVDVVKLMASGGEMTPGSQSWEPQYSLAELRAAVDEAHRHGLPITVHAHAEEAIRRSIDAGVDMIEHCTLMTVNGVSVNRKLIRTIAHAGIPVSITAGYKPGWPLPEKRTLDRMRSVMHNVNLMREAGVRVICSSDAGVSAHKPHGMLPFSVQTFVDAGFTHYEALRAVTSIAAEACGLGTRKGCLVAGYDADLLAVCGNPLEDIGALLNVIAVFRMGQRIR